MLLLLGYLRVEEIRDSGGGCGIVVAHDVVMRYKTEVDFNH